MNESVNYDEIIDFVLTHSNVFLLHLYPAITDKYYCQIESVVSELSVLHYKQKVRLTRRGLINCKKISYSSQGDWIGNVGNRWFGLRKHAKKSIRGQYGSTWVYVLTAEGLGKMRELKARIREIIGKGTWPCHITDTHQEAIELAQIYFNKNALMATNSRSICYDVSILNKRIDEVKKRLETAKLPLSGIIGVGSTPFCIAGIRQAKDFDFLALTKDYEIINDSIYSAHDSQLKYYPYTKQELIMDSNHHFYYRGMKFISLDALLKMKLRRHEWPKDFKDIVRLYLCKVRVYMLDKLVGFRWIV